MISFDWGELSQAFTAANRTKYVAGGKGVEIDVALVNGKLPMLDWPVIKPTSRR